MNGNRYLIDTNIAIYFLTGDQRVGDILDQSQVFVSFISELELLSFEQEDDSSYAIIKEFLNDVVIIDINKKIKDYTIEIRKQRTLKLPDAIIAGTAKFLNIPLMTADDRFKNIEDPQIIFYEK
ncbi:MAG: type II toxin-antitoxin system VapC family toxin [bacterium]|nr:type II toxin-antitoxin system VapC family toxin [bacterium]